MFDNDWKKTLLDTLLLKKDVEKADIAEARPKSFKLSSYRYIFIGLLLWEECRIIRVA